MYPAILTLACCLQGTVCSGETRSATVAGATDAEQAQSSYFFANWSWSKIGVIEFDISDLTVEDVDRAVLTLVFDTLYSDKGYETFVPLRLYYAEGDGEVTTADRTLSGAPLPHINFAAFYGSAPIELDVSAWLTQAILSNWSYISFRIPVWDDKDYEGHFRFTDTWVRSDDGNVALLDKFTLTVIPPLPASGATPALAAFPHDRRKSRYISFDPNKAENDDRDIAFKVELKQLTLGSCGGSGGFCREDRGSDDCNRCSSDGNPCINGPTDCSPVPAQSCEPTGEICANDAPNAGGNNVGQVWWVGPASPLGNDVHLLVSEPFRKVSTDWPSPTHVGDCEIVPQGVYGVRAVEATTQAESDEILVQTTLHAPISSSWWGDCVGPLAKFCGGDIRASNCGIDADCTAPETCDRAWTLPDGSVNFDDVNAALALVAPGPTSVAPDTTWVDLHGNATGTPGSQNFDPPNFVLNFSDIGQIISGFGGFPYKGYDPADCPDVGDWP